MLLLCYICLFTECSICCELHSVVVFVAFVGKVQSYRVANYSILSVYFCVSFSDLYLVIFFPIFGLFIHSFIIPVRINHRINQPPPTIWINQQQQQQQYATSPAIQRLVLHAETLVRDEIFAKTPKTAVKNPHYLHQYHHHHHGSASASGSSSNSHHQLYHNLHHHHHHHHQSSTTSLSRHHQGTVNINGGGGPGGTSSSRKAEKVMSNLKINRIEVSSVVSCYMFFTCFLLRIVYCLALIRLLHAVANYLATVFRNNVTLHFESKLILKLRFEIVIYIWQTFNCERIFCCVSDDFQLKILKPGTQRDHLFLQSNLIKFSVFFYLYLRN